MKHLKSTHVASTDLMFQDTKPLVAIAIQNVAFYKPHVLNSKHHTTAGIIIFFVFKYWTCCSRSNEMLRYLHFHVLQAQLNGEKM